MYNQVSNSSHIPGPPAYQQCPPPPPAHFQQGPPVPQVQHLPTAVPPYIGLSAPHVYVHGPPAPSSAVPLNPSVQVPSSLMQNTGQSYVIPRPLLHGNSMMPQTFSSFGHNSQHSSNLGVNTPHVPPPPLSHPHQEKSWASGPPLRGMPPPPPASSSHSQGQTMYQPPLPPCPPLLGDVQSLQHIPLPPPPPAPSTSGFHAPPPLPSSPPPIPPSPPPLASPVTTASKSSKLCSSELKSVDFVDEVVASGLSDITSFPKESGGYREVALANRDGLFTTRDAILDLPPPPCRPTEDKIVQKIEALCQLIAENGPGIEDKTREDEHNNPEYAFLFGGDLGTEAAISHEYFLWMKKYILEHIWRDKKSESQLRSLVVNSSRKSDHLNVSTECNSAADSDMEMEDDITLSDKDVGLSHTTEALNQQSDCVVENFSMKDQMRQLQNSMENKPVNDILASGVSCSGRLEVIKECEGPELSFDLEHMNSANSVIQVHSTVNDSVEVAQFSHGKSADPLADDLTQHGASDHAEASPHKDSGQLITSGSPIRLLQDYASDDTSDNEDETCLADASTLTVSTRAATSVSAAHIDSGSFLKTDVGSKSPSPTQKGCELLSKALQNDSEVSLHLVLEGKGTHMRSVVSGINGACVKHNLENQIPVKFDASVETLTGEDGLRSGGIGCDSKSGNAEQEDEKRTSECELNPLKVDKFGRFAREGPTDSDSDDSRNRRTRKRNKRDRSWSCSRSPIERNSSRRRSPWRRKDRRSWSRSRSPRNRRSRSRSPILRRSREFNGENVKRDKGQCFDFLRGRCYRGASCWYVHHEPEKKASSRRHRNKHNLEVSSSSKYSRIHEGMKNIPAKVSGGECNVVRSQDMLLCQNVRGSSTGQEVEQRKEDSVRNAVVSTTLDHDGQSVNAASIKSERSREVAPEVRETLVAREEPSTIISDNETSQKTIDSHQQPLVDGFPSNSISGGDALKLSGGASQNVVSSENGSSVQQYQSDTLVGVLEDSDNLTQPTNASFVSDLSPDGNTLISSACKISSSDPLPHTLPSTQLQSTPCSVNQQLSAEQSPLCSQASKELGAHSTLAGFSLHSYPLPPPPAFSHSYGENFVQPQMSRDYVVMQQNTFFPYQSTSREPYPAPLHAQNPHFSVASNSSWMSLPPPPARLIYSSSSDAGVPTSYVSSEFNENKLLHSRTDSVPQIFVRPGVPSNIQGSEYREQAYCTMQEHSRPLMLTETFPSKPLAQGDLAGQSRSVLNIDKDDHYKQLPVHDSKFSSSPSFTSLQSQSKPFSWESNVNRLQPSSYRLPPEEHFKSASLFHPFSQKQQPSYSLQYSASDVNLGVHGETVTVSRFPPDVLDSNHSASLPDLGGSRISAHYNPYASTFEQPLSSKFSSSIFRQEKDIIHVNGSSSSSHRTPVNGQGVFGVESRQTASSPKSARAVGKILPRSGSDQYDPLFDSIEPSSTSLKRFDLDQKQEVTGESNISLRPKSSRKSLDVEENKQWEVAAVASTSSQNNDEYGETADAEVGDVENESLSNPVNVANMTTGEIEIDQVKSPGKKKKSKDSRSMKLFKVSIANFVKEVLKPSWRQGNMSKVAFKTIVKKTVDKVSGAMKGHRVPKSQAKINHYIDSSQRKLTKLVMGYVDKYVKV